MKSDLTLKKIEELYTNNLKSSGKTSAAVGWNTLESQELRFNKLTSVINEIILPVTINDYGCGYGAHLKYLEKNGYKITRYNGYDISTTMIDTAKENLSSFEGRLELYNGSEIKTPADYTFVSGTFNVRFDDDNKSWKNFIKNKLEEINHNSIKGFSFNLLSTYVDYKESHLYYRNPCYWFDYCKNNFSRNISLLHDYPLYEWTIIVKFYDSDFGV